EIDAAGLLMERALKASRKSPLVGVEWPVGGSTSIPSRWLHRHLDKLIAENGEDVVLYESDSLRP
ncbi:MAG: hypothetical protein V3V11_11200, partial [Vicinamibacteria bacterium]